MPAYSRVGMIIIPLFFFGLFYLWPISNLAHQVVDTKSILDVFSSNSIGSIIAFTFIQAAISTIATFIIAIGPTYLIARWDFTGRKLLITLITVPFMLPTVVMATAFVALLPKSVHNSITAIIIVHIFFNIAVVVRIVSSLWSHIPVDVENAAKTLGASRVSTFRKVTLPLISPAIISSSVIVFIFCFTSFGVVKIIGGPTHRTLEVEIARLALNLGDISTAAVLSFMQLIFLGVLGLMFFLCSRKYSHGLTGDMNRTKPRSRLQKFGVHASALLIAIIIMTPLVVLISSSFHVGNNWSTYAWTHLEEYEIRPGISSGVDPLASILTSVRFMVAAVSITLTIGIISTLAIYYSQKWGKLVDISLMLPLGTSAVTIGFGILITLNQGIVNWRTSSMLIPIGHSLIAIPFVVRLLLPVLRSQPSGYHDAAQSLGASPLKTMRSIDLARLKAPVLGAIGIAAAISLGEFGATTFLTRSGNTTAPIAISELIGKTGDVVHAQAFMLSSLLAIVIAAIVFLIEVKNA